jgi:membrane fusion protein, multidrug efflux system
MAQSSSPRKLREVPPVSLDDAVIPARDEAPNHPDLPANDSPAKLPKAARKPSRRLFIVAGIGVVALVAAGWFGYNYLTVGRFMVSTDDAYVGGDIATISSKLSGYVVKVDVVANQRVKAGDPLVTLDDGDYRIARDSAQAQIDTQNLTLNRIDAQVSGAEAALDQTNANKIALLAAQKNAALGQQRAASLAQSAVGSQAALDAANAALDQANAQVAAGDAQIASAKASILVLKGQHAEAEGQLKTLKVALDKANRDLSFAVLKAPYDGVVGNLAVQTGDLVSAGSRLMALVPTEELYVEANFKETQLQQLKPGEKVSIRVDALSDPITGTVSSIAPASGAVFSLLPPENATGNFTKVVQRVPVRIALPSDVLKTGLLQAGLSVMVEADTRTIPKG